MSKLKLVGLLLALLLANGCAEDSEQATALVVSVKSDLTELTGLRVRTYPSNVNLAVDAERPASEATIAMVDLAKPIVINQGSADELLLVVRGLGAQGAQIIEHAIRVRFSDGKSIAVPVFLGRQCLSVGCPNAGETCYAQPTGVNTCGRCAAIALLDEQREIMSAGEEASWAPRMCPLVGGDGGPLPVMDGGGDAGPVVDNRDAGPPDAAPLPPTNDGGPDGGGDAAVCSLPVGWASQCTIAPLCGCESGLGCGLDLPVLDNESPKFSCARRGTADLNAECGTDADCKPGLGCLGLGGSYNACLPDCTAKQDCGSTESCEPIFVSSKAVRGVGSCRQRCDSDADCPEKCCAANKQCAPKSFCETRDGAPCKSAADCIGTSSRKGGACLFSSYPDGGTSAGSCYSTCTKASDCSTGCCYMNPTSGLAFCTTPSGYTAEEKALYCTAQ